MRFVKGSLLLAAISMGLLLVNETKPRGAAQAQMPNHTSSTDAGETRQARIARALAPGPPEVAKAARVVDRDAQGKRIVLREGSNGFTRIPGNPKVVGDPPMCADAAIPIGPHWMIMWPFDPKTTGLPTTHKETGAYILWTGSPYAHLHVMGRP